MNNINPSENKAYIKYGTYPADITKKNQRFKKIEGKENKIPTDLIKNATDQLNQTQLPKAANLTLPARLTNLPAPDLSSSISEAINEESEFLENNSDFSEDRPIEIPWDPTSIEVNEMLVSTVPADFGLLPSELEILNKFYTSQKPVLETMVENIRKQKSEEFGFDYPLEPIFLHRTSVDPALPRNIVFIPAGPQQGLYALMSTKGNLKEIGMGSFNKITLALDMKTGAKKVFRSASASHISDHEIGINNKLSEKKEYLEHFIVGSSVNYIGNYRKRAGITGAARVDQPKTYNEEKVGFIMDFIEGGDLATHLQKPLSFEEKLGVAKQYAENIALLNKIGYVHLDQKEQNALVTKDSQVKLCDFGLCKREGTSLRGPCGSPGYIAPELMTGDSVYVNKALDAWMLGCVLMKIYHGDAFFNWNIKTNYDDHFRPNRKLSPDELEEEKAIILENRTNKQHPDYIIDKCLQINPQDRKSTQEVSDFLKDLH